MLNEPFGWMWTGMGMLSGIALAPAMKREDWLGGYASRPRRLLRLGHIAMAALGLLNVLFALSAPRVGWSPAWVHGAGWSLIVGAVAMPACCALSAWRPGLHALFAVPVVSLLFGVTVTWTGMVLP